MTVPHIRYGTDEHYFDSLIADAGFLEPDSAGPAAGALLVQLAFGVTIDPELLERPLPAARFHRQVRACRLRRPSEVPGKCWRDGA
jgi:hypothetical protein